MVNTEVVQTQREKAKLAVEKLQTSLAGVEPHLTRLEEIEAEIVKADAEWTSLKQRTAAELEHQKLSRAELEQRYRQMGEWLAELEAKAGKLREEVIALEGQVVARKQDLETIKAERDAIKQKAGW